MHSILLFGAGQSSGALIDYLLKVSDKEKIQLFVADKNLEVIVSKTKNHANATAILLDVEDTVLLKKHIQACTIVISMLPAAKHIVIAKECLLFKKNLVTASYISDEMQALHNAAKENNLLFLNEMGLDPGIDHMSAMKMVNEIKAKNGYITSFTSACGGLPSVKNSTNLWNYKFTWAPKNVVLAGQGKASKFLDNGKEIKIPYSELFLKTSPVAIDNLGELESYANRDALRYKKTYQLDTAKTVVRSTLRNVGYCAAWHIFVQLGMTDNEKILPSTAEMSYRDFMHLFLPKARYENLENYFLEYFTLDTNDPIWKKMVELDIFSESKKIAFENVTAAEILEKILKETWTLKNEETDMVVLQHCISYVLKNEQKTWKSQLVLEGKNKYETAMAITVGLPVGMAALLILKNKITVRGVQIPIYEEIYEPILKELQLKGVSFTETHI